MNYPKIFNKLLLFLLLILAIQCKTDKQNALPERPNILFIMSDDHAYQAISAYSDHLIQTPNIDRIADEGMKFTNACVTNSICAPSRAVILTGKHSHLNGKIDNRFPFDTNQITFPQILQNNGYQTAMFGKLHFGNSPKGFDQFKILPGQGTYYNPDFITKNDGRINIEGYTSDLITDMTLDWLTEERQEDEPFLLMYLHKAPHREWLPHKRHSKDYINKTFPEPNSLLTILRTSYQNGHFEVLISTENKGKNAKTFWVNPYDEPYLYPLFEDTQNNNNIRRTGSIHKFLENLYKTPND